MGSLNVLQQVAGQSASQSPSGSMDVLKQVQSDPSLAFKAPASVTDTGSVKNDVGNQVIVPKEGESFADTLGRAAQYGQTMSQNGSLNPQGQQAVNKELATAPAKAAETLGAAPVIGAAGAAGLAGAGEAGAAALSGIATHTIEGVKAVGQWATREPLKAYLLLQVLKEALPGVKKALGFVRDAPE